MEGQKKDWKELASHFSKTVTEYSKGKALLTTWACGAVVSVAAASYMHYKDGKNKRNSKDTTTRTISSSGENKEGLIKEWIEILKIPFSGLFKPATLHLMFYTSLLLVRIVLTIKIATLAGALGKVKS